MKKKPISLRIFCPLDPPFIKTRRKGASLGKPSEAVAGFILIFACFAANPFQSQIFCLVFCGPVSFSGVSSCIRP
jgi:hypothetical protein